MSSPTEPSHAQAVSHQVTAFIEGLKEAIVVSMAAAAEGIRLESEVARVMQRMGAYHAVLEGIESQKQALRELLKQNRSAAEKERLRFQLKLLDQQTIAVLTRSGLRRSGFFTPSYWGFLDFVEMRKVRLLPSTKWKTLQFERSLADESSKWMSEPQGEPRREGSYAGRTAAAIA
ncbi:Hypothetical protein PBC10988_34970 [Planctomycetales bacterium 10988]|nr:Hypothetical protein PBC10988_34970 [Planctomycetales bacterium 10988]